MEVILIITSMLLIAGGIIFSILPPLPGSLMSYGAMIAAHFISNETHFSTTSFIVWGALSMLIIVGDFALPIAVTKKYGGTKAGIIGGMIGTVAGILLPIPLGIILGPLFGAIIGDLYAGSHLRSAFKSGFGSFLGFLIATSAKVAFSLILGIVVIWEVGSFTIDAIVNLF